MITKVTKGESTGLEDVSAIGGTASAENLPQLAKTTNVCCLVADHEIVDVDGFVFKRKRRTPLTDSMNLPAAQAKRAKPSAELEVGHTLCSLWAEGPSDSFSSEGNEACLYLIYLSAS